MKVINKNQEQSQMSPLFINFHTTLAIFHSIIISIKLIATELNPNLKAISHMKTSPSPLISGGKKRYIFFPVLIKYLRFADFCPQNKNIFIHM